MNDTQLEPAEAAQADAPAVHGSPTLDQVTAAARQLALAVGGWAVGRGYLEADTVTALATVAVIVAPFLYGQWKTRMRAKQALGMVGRR